VPPRVLKFLVFVLCVLPGAWLVGRALTGGLSANPVEDITRTTGIWSLRLLLVSLAVTPVRRVTGWNAVIGVRRMLGLFAFGYVCLHLATYVVFDHVFDPRTILEDIAKRRYITAGFAAFLLLVPLAVTSTAGWIARLGGRRWRQLHRLVYVAAVLAVVHYLWLVKGADLRSPLMYGAILLVLLGVRVAYWRRGHRKA
jgi:methionine sulfoxide reductase heme-binding subunit